MAGDIIQALSGYLKIEDLQSTADFPDDMKVLSEILTKVRRLCSFNYCLFYYITGIFVLVIMYNLIYLLSAAYAITMYFYPHILRIYKCLHIQYMHIICIPPYA